MDAKFGIVNNFDIEQIFKEILTGVTAKGDLSYTLNSSSQSSFSSNTDNDINSVYQCTIKKCDGGRGCSEYFGRLHLQRSKKIHYVQFLPEQYLFKKV